MPDYWKIMSDGFKDGKLLAITLGNFNRDMGNTIRFSETQVQRYAYRIADGVVQSVTTGKPVSTHNYSSHDKAGIAAFVVGLDGTVYLFNHLNKTDQIAHSSFVGKFAKAAGELIVVEGKITLVHAHSGHFRPNALNMYHAVKYFRDMGALSPSARVGFVSNPFADTGVEPPPYAESLPFQYVLDEESKRTYANSKQVIEESSHKITQLDLETTLIRFQAHKEQTIKRLTEEVQALAEKLKSENGTRSTTEFELELKTYALEDANELAFDAYLKELKETIRELKTTILQQQDLIEMLDIKTGTLRVVFDALVFLGFVGENFVTLRGKIKPAFFDASL
ncbi:hypothetical protein [Pseudomonas sp. Irchel 3E13]|uniref:hypothetical protein n=1 Tax=Pseudomonas sp. Irchel 3E13 TaxID=2008975 RepID=UPI000BA46864|nr:hypothetical protein [Pseudomonas sp. Irchel 3E13]